MPARLGSFDHIEMLKQVQSLGLNWHLTNLTLERELSAIMDAERMILTVEFEAVQTIAAIRANLGI